MASHKWTTEEICKLFDIYEQNQTLWNTHVRDYHNKHKRLLSWENLRQSVAESGLGQFETVQLRRKISTLRTVYRTEVVRIIKSKERQGKLYKPCLMWFDKAHKFLQSVTSDELGQNPRTVNIVDPLQEETVKDEINNDLSDEEEIDHYHQETMPRVITPNPGEDKFDVLARHVASQLRRMPLESALQLEGEIHELVIQERMGLAGEDEC